MNQLYVVFIVYYDRELSFCFGRKRKLFYSIEEAMDYIDKLIPLNDTVFTYGPTDDARSIMFNSKYIKHVELELY